MKAADTLIYTICLALMIFAGIHLLPWGLEIFAIVWRFAWENWMWPASIGLTIWVCLRWEKTASYARWQNYLRQSRLMRKLRVLDKQYCDIINNSRRFK